MSQMSTDNSNKVQLIYKHKIKNISIEKELHKKYKHKKIRGEWFELTEEDIKDIKQWLKKLKNPEQN